MRGTTDGHLVVHECVVFHRSMDMEYGAVFKLYATKLVINKNYTIAYLARK